MVVRLAPEHKRPTFLLDVDLPPMKMFETAEMLVNDIRGMVQRRELFSKLLRVADHMKAFVYHRMGDKEELHLRLEQFEANLVVARKVAAENAKTLKRFEMEKEALRSELERVKNGKKPQGPSSKMLSMKMPSWEGK